MNEKIDAEYSEKLRRAMIEMIERWEQAVASLNVEGFDVGQMRDAMDTYLVPNVLHYFWDDFKLYQNRVGRRLDALEKRLEEREL